MSGEDGVRVEDESDGRRAGDGSEGAMGSDVEDDAGEEGKGRGAEGVGEGLGLADVDVGGSLREASSCILTATRSTSVSCGKRGEGVTSDVVVDGGAGAGVGIVVLARLREEASVRLGEAVTDLVEPKGDGDGERDLKLILDVLGVGANTPLAVIADVSASELRLTSTLCNTLGVVLGAKSTTSPLLCAKSDILPILPTP